MGITCRDGDIKVKWVRLGEGYQGDYNPEDPNDEELLRFDISVGGETVSSYCTLLPCKASRTEKKAALELLLRAIRELAPAGAEDRLTLIDLVGERMSYLSLEHVAGGTITPEGLDLLLQTIYEVEGLTASRQKEVS